MLTVYLVLMGFSHLGCLHFGHISHFPAPTKGDFLQLSAQSGDSPRPCPRVVPNSETGDIPASASPQREC